MSAKMTVAPLDLAAQSRPPRGELVAAFGTGADTGRFILGPEVERREPSSAAVPCAKYGIGMSSGTDALLVLPRRAPRRDAPRAHLTKADIGTELCYPMPFHLQAGFADLGYETGAFPNTEREAGDPELTALQQEYVVEQAAAFYGAST